MTIQLVEFGGGVGYMKAGLYGDAGSGKTYTATELALFIKAHFKLPGDIYFQDTETGAEYVNWRVKKETGKNIVGLKSRTIGDACELIADAEKREPGVVIIDSMTHISEEVKRSWIKQYNEWAELNKKPKRSKVEWQDLDQVNGIYDRLTNAYLNAKVHIILCGRSANIWERTVNEDTGKTELNKTGTKMKTQTNLAYEPSFLAEMAREQLYVDGVQRIVRTMTVLKERFSIMDGKMFENPTGKDFLPHLERLTPGADNTVDVAKETPMGISGDGDTAFKGEQIKKQVAFETLCAELDAAFTGQSADMKVARQKVAKMVFGTPSSTEIERMPSAKIRDGIAVLPQAIQTVKEDMEREAKAEEVKAAAEKASKKRVKEGAAK